MPKKARVAATSRNESSVFSARSINVSSVRSGHVPYWRQSCRISFASSTAGILTNDQLQLLGGTSRDGCSIGDDRVPQRRSALASSRRKSAHHLPDQPACV